MPYHLTKISHAEKLNIVIIFILAFRFDTVVGFSFDVSFIVRLKVFLSGKADRILARLVFKM